MRTYTAEEVGRMRGAISSIYVAKNLVRHFTLEGFSARTEDELRTYIAAGVDPAELELEAEKIKETDK